MLSDYCKTLWEKENKYYVNGEAHIRERFKTTKLVTMLNYKSKYIIHISALKSCLEQGLKIKKIHRVLSFQQSSFLKSFIDHNIEKRKASTNEFEDAFWKLVNNATFGKTLENVRDRVKIDLVHTERKLQTLTNKPSFKRAEIINDNLVSVERVKTKVLLNKPIYVGQAILDIQCY